MSGDTSGDRPAPDPFAGALWAGNAASTDLIWRLLGAPPLDGYEPAAVTAVLVAIDPQGRVARYPLYGQISEACLLEQVEVANAITLLHEWQNGPRPVLRTAVEHRERPDGGTVRRPLL